MQDKRFYWQGGIARTVWRCETYKAGGTDDGRWQVHDIDEAELVSSLTEDGLHAPAFDFDFQTDVMPLEDGGARVTMRIGPVRTVDWDALLGLCADLGIVRRAFADDPSACLVPSDDRALAIEFCVPAQMFRSSNQTHAHVYLGCKLPWDDYRALCEAMRNAGLMTERYVQYAIDRGMTMLLKPGFRKTDLLAKPGVRVEDGWGRS